MNVTEKKHHVMDKLDHEYVRERIEEICGDFIRNYSLKSLMN